MQLVVIEATWIYDNFYSEKQVKTFQLQQLGQVHLLQNKVIAT